MRVYEEILEAAEAERLTMIEANARGDSRGYVSSISRHEALLREAALSLSDRKKLSKSDFVFPEKAPGSGSYPIHDRAHGANALSRSEGKAEHGAVKAKVCKRYPDLPACQGS